MARRREAKETFLIRQRGQLEEARKHEHEAAMLLDSRRSSQEGSKDSESPQKQNFVSAKKYYTITEPTAAVKTSDENNVSVSDIKEKSSDTTSNTNNGSSSSNDNISGNDQKTMKKITIQKMNKETGLIDIYTYHKGRVGDEVRDPKTGELLCDSDPVDTNHKWIPPKMLVKVTVSFPLGDPDEEEYQDSDLSDEEEDAQNNINKGEFQGGDLSMRSTPTRASLSKSRFSRSSTDGNSLSGISDKIDKSADKELPRFVQTVDWDLGDPSTPTAEEYAATIASEFGLTFPQTMDLKESIQKQLADFTHRQPHFYAPIKILDPYGNERPNAAFGPPERHCGSVCGSGNKLSIRRSTSGASSSRRSTGGVSSSSSRGAVKPDRRGISVVPKDQIEGPNKSGNKFAEEILKRCKQSSKSLSTELISKGQAALSIQKNEVCHICHNRKDTVLCFPCGRHAYCDYHCGSRLSFRAGDYDPKNPTSLPIDYCPVCTLHCTCSRCIRRLETLAGKLEEQCNKQQCGPGEVVMEGLTQLCADGSRHGITNNKKKSKDKQDKKRRRSDEGDDSTPRPPSASRSSRSSPIQLEDGKPPKKQRKSEPTPGPVPVLKVHPSEFPVELVGLTDADPSDPEDMTKIFTPGGAFDAEDSSSPGFPLVAKAASKYQDIIEVQIEKSFLMNCALCNEEGTDERICCSNCPRAFHTKCFEQSTSAVTFRECKRCGNDREILPEDEILESIAINEKIKSAYSHLANTPNFIFCGVMLSQILDILEKLKGYDYGWVFAEPVNTDEVQDYLEVIKRPMDYSTIALRLEQAAYGSESEQSSINGVDANMDPMEVILLNVLCDVDQVHQNCFIYNLKDSAFYRAGVVQHKKWNSYFEKYIKERLLGSMSVQSGFNKFRLNCEQALAALKNGQRFIKPKQGNGVNCRQYAVFDPDTKRIIKQYTSKASARLAALALHTAGYQCEWDLTEQNAKSRVDVARDPKKLLFGYQWIPTDDLKSGKFKMKEADPYVHNSELKSPTNTTNVLILKEDTVSGAEIRGFESEESAYQDWLQERTSSVATSDDNAEDINISAFVKSYLDGQASINGIIWKRVLPRQSPVPELAPSL